MAVTDHMPPQHRFYADWSPERILRWAGEIGSEVAALVGKALDEREHPEQGFKVPQTDRPNRQNRCGYL